MAIEREEIERLAKDRDDEHAILDRNVYGRLTRLLRSARCPIARSEGLQEGRPITRTTVVSEYPRSQWWMFAVEDEKVQTRTRSAPRPVRRIASRALSSASWTRSRRSSAATNCLRACMKMVKVFVAVKRKIQPGDKMAGRHGNKGVVVDDPAGRGHAVPRRRHARRHRPEPAGRAVAHERRPGARDAPRLGCAKAWASKIGTCSKPSKVGDPSSCRTRCCRRRPNGRAPRTSTTTRCCRLAATVSDGVPIATPVFDGAHEARRQATC